VSGFFYSIHMRLLLILSVFYLIAGCNSKVKYDSLPAFATIDSSAVYMVVEIPAGESIKFEYNKDRDLFEAELIDGKPREIRFLPYPVNYGFIPSTFSDPEDGGDGDPVDALLLSKRQATGSLVSAMPLGTFRLIDRGEIDDKVLLIPTDENLRLVPCESLACLLSDYPEMLQILENWFMSYKGPGMMSSNGWMGPDSTMHMIRASAQSFNSKR
jgi:inorganic pyrophosphatase